jgi:1-deoxy-D-xylulose-5-phosphate reductoisomerase
MTASHCKRIAIAGSTGSVGRQALEVIRRNPEAFSIKILSAQNNATLLIQQAIEFKPEAVVIGNKQLYKSVNNALKGLAIKVFAGKNRLNQFAEFADFDLLLNALVGIDGLQPTLNAIEHHKTIALANKECLVSGGRLLMQSAKKHNTRIIPVDSEHSAIFQCLQGENHNSIEKIYLTASGGPFRGIDRGQLADVTPAEALDHPNWQMGKKVSIDSATMMNKGMEAIAAQCLFGLHPRQIEMVLHPQSVIHSIVQFTDGSMKAQMGRPDMKLPIQYALSYPDRLFSDYPRYDFNQLRELHFEALNISEYPCLLIATYAMQKGGNIPCALNAANEAAVEAFLNKKIGFLLIAEVIEQSISCVPYYEQPDLKDIIDTNKQARDKAQEVIKTICRLNR